MPLNERARRRRDFLKKAGGLLLLVFACGKAAPTDPADALATVAQVAAAVTGQESPMADGYEKVKYLGFDTYRYPGDSVMRAWREAKDAPYKWVGYYLPAPCHRDSSWTGRRQALAGMGWGLAVVYVGQQTWGKVPRPVAPVQRAALVRRGRVCDVAFLDAQQGRADADDAIARTAAEGFAPGTVIFLDIERSEGVPAAMRDYYREWTRRVLEDRRYRPGYYVHKDNAQLVHDDVQDVFTTAGVADEPRFWVASGRDFDPAKAAPTDVGHAFAGVWQGVIDAARSVADIKLPVDVSVAAWPSPSDWTVGE